MKSIKLMVLSLLAVSCSTPIETHRFKIMSAHGIDTLTYHGPYGGYYLSNGDLTIRRGINSDAVVASNVIIVEDIGVYEEVTFEGRIASE